MEFYFCESCGKRITGEDLKAGEGKNKKLRGVFCRSCSVGVATMEMLPLSNEKAGEIPNSEHHPGASTKPATPPRLQAHRGNIQHKPRHFGGDRVMDLRTIPGNHGKSAYWIALSVALGFAIVSGLFLVLGRKGEPETHAVVKRIKTPSHPDEAVSTAIRKNDSITPSSPTVSGISQSSTRPARGKDSENKEADHRDRFSNRALEPENNKRPPPAEGSDFHSSPGIEAHSSAREQDERGEETIRASYAQCLDRVLDCMGRFDLASALDQVEDTNATEKWGAWAPAWEEIRLGLRVLLERDRAMREVLKSSSGRVIDLNVRGQGSIQAKVISVAIEEIEIARIFRINGELHERASEKIPLKEIEGLIGRQAIEPPDEDWDAFADALVALSRGNEEAARTLLSGCKKRKLPGFLEWYIGQSVQRKLEAAAEKEWLALKSRLGSPTEDGAKAALLEIAHFELQFGSTAYARASQSDRLSVCERLNQISNYSVNRVSGMFKGKVASFNPKTCLCTVEYDFQDPAQAADFKSLTTREVVVAGYLAINRDQSVAMDRFSLNRGFTLNIRTAWQPGAKSRFYIHLGTPGSEKSWCGFRTYMGELAEFFANEMEPVRAKDPFPQEADLTLAVTNGVLIVTYAGREQIRCELKDAGLLKELRFSKGFRDLRINRLSITAVLDRAWLDRMKDDNLHSSGK